VRHALVRLLRTGRWVAVALGLRDNRLLRRYYDEAAMQLRRGGSVVMVQGLRMRLDEQDSLKLSVRGVHERAGTELVKELVKPGWTVLDIGAHIGYYTVLCARAVGEMGKVYAFEPSSKSAGLLTENVRLNKLDNVVIVKKAVGDASGPTSLYLAGDSGDHRVFDSRDGRAIVSTESTRLDDIKALREQTVQFIKMDVQGSEASVLRGARELLERSSDVVIMTEFWPYGLALAGSDPASFLRELDALGFRLSIVGQGPVTVDDLQAMYDPSRDDFSVDLLCRRFR
jgi:FkbM family methyltransferase